MNLQLLLSKADDVIDKYWDGRLPIDPFKICGCIGIPIEYSKEFIDDTCGVFKYSDKGVKFIINPTSVKKRIRFCGAHLLGHYILNERETILEPPSNFNLNVKNEKEILANQFAVAMLTPEEVLRHVINKNKNNIFDILCQSFDVSGVLMHERLKDIGII